MSTLGEKMIAAAAELRDAVNALSFAAPVTHTYNPLDYAWAVHELYLKKFATTRKRLLFLGMNPGPWGMMQTGVPFGEIRAVRDWMGITAAVHRPADEHPKRPVLGFACPRSEPSGRKLWALFAQRFGTPDVFFREHFVVNYCPLAFLKEPCANYTPDKLPQAEQAALFAACDEHLRRVVELLQPEWLVGVGKFAEARFAGSGVISSGRRVAGILHPSPASPAAHHDWHGKVTRQLQTCGAWT